MTRTDVLMLLRYSAELWPLMRLPADRESLDVRVQAWLDVLGDLDAGQVRAALAGLADREFAPPVGQIRKAVEAHQDTAAGVALPDPDQAWAEFYAAACKGIYDEPDWSHDAIKEAARGFDLRALGLGDEGDLVNITQSHFRRAYEVCCKRWNRTHHAPPPALAAFTLRTLDELEAG